VAALLKPIAIYYEHPDWFRPLFEELDTRGVSYVKIDASCHSYDPGASVIDFSLLFNRMSASAYLRGNAHAIFYTYSYLRHLEVIGIPVVNGSRAFAFEISKAHQLELLQSLGLSFPRTRIVNCVANIPAAAEEIGFPLLVKPNIGGRGAGILRFESVKQLETAINAGKLQLGIDNVALVQEFIPARNGHITRVETLGGKFLYAINTFTTGENFNLCPAEICQVENVASSQSQPSSAPKIQLKVQRSTPPPAVIAAVDKIVAWAGIDAGGVEYITDDRDGRVLFYDINALSNFVADAQHNIGFDPHARLVDFLVEQQWEDD
jgi:hypothetical protein